MSIKEREKAIKDFSNGPDKFIMINSLKSGGVGLNLTMASRVISLDLWWNSNVEQQGKHLRLECVSMLIPQSLLSSISDRPEKGDILSKVGGQKHS